jgi:hypothetical protein
MLFHVCLLSAGEVRTSAVSGFYCLYLVDCGRRWIVCAPDDEQEDQREDHQAQYSFLPDLLQRSEMHREVVGSELFTIILPSGVVRWTSCGLLV